MAIDFRISNNYVFYTIDGSEENGYLLKNVTIKKSNGSYSILLNNIEQANSDRTNGSDFQINGVAFTDNTDFENWYTVNLSGE